VLAKEVLISTVNVVFSVAGGLALFLYGLRVLSEALKKAAGEQMRVLLERLTGKAWRGALVGAATAGILQSSSMTMVLLIGLLNAGVLTLSQGIGVMLGGEIGTTLTAQLIAVKIGLYYLPIIAVGALLWTLFPTRRVGDVGKVFLGSGIVFLGMSILTSGVAGVANSPTVLNLLASCGTNVWLGAVVGAAVTAFIHSSAATTAMVIAMGSAGLLTLPAAIALVLGANVGTTFTGLIASMGSCRASRQLSLTQILVNVVGAVAALPLVPLFARFIATTSPSLPRQIANAHSVFNVASTLAFLPLVGVLVWAVQRIVPGKDRRADTAPRFLGRELLRTPSIAVQQAKSELLRMGRLTEEMLEICEDGILRGRSSTLAAVAEKEEEVDALRRAIDDFLSRIDASELPAKEARRWHVLQHAAGDIERVGDHAVNIAERAEAQRREGFTFSAAGEAELADMLGKARRLYHLALEALETEDRAPVEEALRLEKEVDRLETLYKEHHIARLEEGACNPTAGILFVEVLRNLERIGDHAVNVAGDVVHIESTRATSGGS
jgi:phosphate:Na+ symporter